MDRFEKNLKALEKNRPFLHKLLKEIEGNERFEVFLPKNVSYANIFDKKKKQFFYSDVDNDIASMQIKFERYREYPFVYMYGIGNGAVIDQLLKNDKLTQIVIVEPNLELIYIALNLYDWGEYLKSNKLIILMEDEVTKKTVIALMHSSNAKYYIKVFDLLLNCSYYETVFSKEYIAIYKKFLDVLRYVAEANGNDINDTFRGVKQHFENMNDMIHNHKLQELLKKKNTELAVIVSTGPSLTKQLPLLKQYQDNITIISVDASFPILIKNGIVPDVVTSMERDEPTAKFFQDTSLKEQEKTIFLCASLQHQSVFKAIKSEKLVIAMRPFAYNNYFELDDYGYICKGMSSANMAHELAVLMGFKQCAFIGQDLAFGKDLKTHADDHVITDMDPEIQAQIESGQLFEIEAYGGNGTVKTNRYWNIFKDFIEQLIEDTQPLVNHYNATEGGARIAGSIEKPLAWVLQKYAQKEKKELIICSTIDLDDVVFLQKQTTQKLQKIVTESKILQEEVNRVFLKIADKTKILENKEIEDAIELLSIGETLELLNAVSTIRKNIENSTIYGEFLVSIVQPLMYNMELELAEIKVRYIDNPKDNQVKALQWILAHRYWLFSFSGVIDNVLHIIQNLEIKEGIS